MSCVESRIMEKVMVEKKKNVTYTRSKFTNLLERK
jgi:hypothetical protein